MQIRSWVRGLGTVLIASVALLGGAAAGHHSFAMFDPARAIVLEGAVKEFSWTNPHVTLVMLVKPKAGGEPETWTVELNSPGNLSHSGWSHTTLKPGDWAQVTIHPLRNGQKGGEFRSLKTASGQVFDRGAAGAKGEGVP